MMGFFDFLKPRVQCPVCGATDARKSGERVVCPNPLCENSAEQQRGATVGAAPPTVAGKPAAVPRGRWQPRQPLVIRYRNFQDTEQTYTAEAESCRRERNHISVAVAPTGRRITLRRDRIQNLAEVEARCNMRVAPGQDWPSPRERQVLNYHKKHQSTSPLYERIRAKYPDW